ncbi:hypothetical protein Btru_027503 [Bulinus truncatus]|nr:hypothetical protein Btru_027503 [Bulinus truncatus]
MFKVCFIFLIVIYNLHSAHCYRGGAPDDSCTNVSPTHGTSTASGQSPYQLTLSRSNYTPGDTIKVTLSGGQFHGFLIVARKTNGETKDIGTFTALPNGTKITCSTTTGHGVTHSSRDVKTNVNFNWTAPFESVGDIVFKYSVVMDSKTNYFNNLNSSVVRALQPSPGRFFKDLACGKSKGCYSNCINNECDWETSWQDTGDHLNISVKAFLATDNGYVALGFSNQSAMGPATVYSCALLNGTVQVIPGRTNGHRYTTTNKTTDDISYEVNSYSNGIMQCTFSVFKVNNISNSFNLSEAWYLISARGPFNGSVRFHTNRSMTSVRVSLKDVTFNDHIFTPTVAPTQTTTVASAAQIGKFSKDADCGSKKGCYSNCKDNQCDLLLAWAPKGDNHEITLKTATGNQEDYYIALGFSQSDASVAACTVNKGSVVDVYMSRNEGFDNIPLDNPKDGVSLISGSYKDGILQCTFNRTASSNNSKIFNLTKSWYLITARGKAGSGGTLMKHDDDDRFLSAAEIDFQDIKVDISLEATKYPMIKAHGCLMVIAWMFLASIGLGFARFLKPLWPNSMQCGVKVWFSMHRAFMVLAFVCGCVGFILIFIEVKDYSEIRGEFYTKTHPILGIITTALLFINPFMSLLRCAPDSPSRPYFNWAHRAVGTIALILSTITITVGLYLPKAQVNTDSGLIIMIVYSAWHLFYFLIMSLLNDMTFSVINLKLAKSKKKGNAYALNNVNQSDDVKNPGSSDKKPDPPNSGLKKFFMFIHVCVLCALTIALLYYVIDGKV